MLGFQHDISLNWYSFCMVKDSSVKEIARAIKKSSKNRVTERRKQIGAGFISFGNLAVASLVFSQILEESTPKWEIVFTGIMFFVLMYIGAYLILRRVE